VTQTEVFAVEILISDNQKEKINTEPHFHDYAEKLILSKDVNISETAYEVGFYNVSSFNRVFKRIRKYPPGDIKKSRTAKE